MRPFTSSRDALSLALLLLAPAHAAGAPQAGRVLGLHEYAERGDLELLGRRIRAGRDPDVASARFNLRTPLHLAAQNGHAAAVTLLLEAGVDANARTDRGFTPLHLAACAGHTEVIDRLLAGGALRDACDETGRSPLHLAVFAQGVDSLRALLPIERHDLGIDGHGRTPLHDAASIGQLEHARLLVDAGLDLDQRSASGSTALHFAARRGDRAMLDLLLEAGADPERRDLLGRKPAELEPGSAALGVRPAPSAADGELLAVPDELRRAVGGRPAIFTTWTVYCPGPGPQPEGCDLAIWPDGVVLFSAARARPNQELRVGRISQARLAFLWRELEEAGILDELGRELSGPGSTVRSLRFTRGDRRASAGAARSRPSPGARFFAEDLIFLHGYRLAAELLERALPDPSWPFEELCVDGVYRGYDPEDANAWMRDWFERDER